MAEGKLIFYAILGAGYLLYSLFKKNAAHKTALPSSKPVKPVVSKTIDEILSEARQAQARVNRPLQQVKAPLKKEILAEEKAPEKFEEGITNFRTFGPVETLEEHWVEESERKRENIAPATFDFNEEEKMVVAIDPRQAFIGSLIFERKF